MKRSWAAVLCAASITAAYAGDELPATDESQPLEIEPPLLIQNRGADGSLTDAQPNAPGDLDAARLEVDVARAKERAAAGERLYKAGILAKVEAEDRALKVVRLEAKLCEARVQAAKSKIEELKSANTGDETFARELKAAEALLAETTEAAGHAAETLRGAEVEAAARNVERQRKLLALGSGRKADMNRAEEKLAELQRSAR